MRYGTLGQSGGGTATVEPGTASTAGAGSVAVKEIPYDYVATFKLTGTRGTRVQDVITISTEGTFVAVSVGSSFAPAEERTYADDRTGAVRHDVRAGCSPPRRTEPRRRSPLLAESLLLRFGGIHFLYTIVDSGSGRELQNKAVHNIAGLGAADGERPFRPFARPVPFVPRSTIRIEIEELSAGPFFRDGTLFLVLHGYKRLGE